MQKPPTQIVAPIGISSAEVVGHSATVWQSANYAKNWHDDALREAKCAGRDARRREIVFSAGFIESYFYEWTRRLVNVDIVKEFFTRKGGEKFNQKICRVLKKLGEDGYIPSNTKLDLSKLGTLMEYRNGLMHGGASRPMTARQAQKEKPKPTIKNLEDMQPGWALDICRDVITSLHKQIDQPLPDYIQLSKE